jgi:hypothetical protein
LTRGLYTYRQRSKFSPLGSSPRVTLVLVLVPPP